MSNGSSVSPELIAIAFWTAREAYNQFRYHEPLKGKDWGKKAVDTLKKWVDLQKGDVKIDVYSYTGETMHDVISLVIQDKVAGGLLDNRSVEIRILQRNCKLPFLLRNYEVNPDYERYDKAVADTATSALLKWREKLEGFSDNVKIHFKAYKFEPSFKAVIINGSKGYFGFYKIDLKHEKETLKGVFAPDYVAKDTDLLRLDNPKIGVGAMVLNSFKDWFERAWDNFSEPVEESECIYF
jgi:hypothetical protein